MKKILLTVVLGVATAAGAQTASQPAQGQPAASSQGPVIKDPAEYNAYVAALGQTDPNAKISGLEAFVTQYPNSVMKGEAMKQLMAAYQQTNNVKKALDVAQKLVTADPCQENAMTLLTYYDRAAAQNGDPNGKQLSADAEKYGQQGLDCLTKFQKPDGTSDADFEKMKVQMKANFIAGIGWGELQNKNYPKAAEELKAAIDANPDNQKDLMLVYPLALSYLSQTPPDYQNGIWFAARAAAVAPPANAPALEKYARSQYVKFHSADDGWAEVLAAAKANGPQVPIKPAPTPADQAHKMVQDTAPDKMDFATWEFVLTNGAQEDQDSVWTAIKGKAVQMNGTIISTTPTEFQIAGSADDIEAKKADITLKFEDKLPAKMIPKDGASYDFQGEPASYTASPFMMVMEKGTPLRQAAPTPAKKPVHHKASGQ